MGNNILTYEIHVFHYTNQCASDQSNIDQHLPISSVQRDHSKTGIFVLQNLLLRS